MNRTVLIILLVITFFISFSDFIFTSAQPKHGDRNSTYSSSGGGGGGSIYWGSYGGGDYSSVRGTSSKHTQRGVGSAGK